MTKSADATQRSRDLLSRSDSQLLIVDVQEKLIPHVAQHESVTAACRRLIVAADLLGVPVTATEQYPQGLGPTVPELAELLGGRCAKLSFSAADALDGALPDDDPATPVRDQIVVAGIEAHVCILQTCLDLAARGFRVFVVADAIGSRNTSDRDIAVQRMRDCGATVVTTESVLFEWCEVAGTAEFKQISRLVKESGRQET